MLSEREQKILEYIETKMELDGIPPTIREICSDLQIKSTSTAHKEVNRLIEEGYLVKRRNKTALCVLHAERNGAGNREKKFRFLERLQPARQSLLWKTSLDIFTMNRKSSMTIPSLR